jgi:restriction system protein
MSTKPIAPSKASAIKSIYKCFELLKSAGGEMPRNLVLEKLATSLDFSEWELEPLKSNGKPRWISVFLWYSVNCIKSGFLVKNSGTWILTAEGESAMKGGKEALFQAIIDGYRKWSISNDAEPEISDGIATGAEQNQSLNIELMEQQAMDGIFQLIKNMNPYEFQDLVGALLRSMGYHTEFIAARGRDGGIDIIAYQDALGLKTPRIKVQIKHYPTNPIAVDALRSLKGILHSGEDVGLFVTSGSFSAEAKKLSRESNIHIKLIDGPALIELWKNNYHLLPDTDKSKLPLHPVYFPGKPEN